MCFTVCNLPVMGVRIMCVILAIIRYFIPNRTSCPKHDTFLHPIVILGRGCSRELPLGTGSRRPGERSGVYGRQITDINLDGVLGTRLVEEQLSAFLEFEPKEMRSIFGRLVTLRDMARRVSNVGSENVRQNNPEYSYGHVMDPSPKLLWHKSRSVERGLLQHPVPCALSTFNETDSDQCLQEVVGRGNEPRNICHMSDRCLEGMSAPRQQGYILTHQVLYWQMLQMHDCVRNVSESLQVSLCSNVLRDAERIAMPDFLGHIGISSWNKKFDSANDKRFFLVAVGLCGMWGFRDFHRFDWLETILSWQQPSGCFNDRAKWHCVDDLKPDPPLRVERREKVLKDGCLSHKTTVALLAITANIRFEAEQNASN
ncbi:UPF0764 protein C16orf89 homolog [Trichonephila inaurata madagascariensis]|uniref:UPF0764 protein C16orf89 homolog n=1 Tax=Trichonephila inaurata madagascariensis TaxID=2747483 RepID=A0A8X6KE40_9ARAC|nr:UPF0764 protein C16orf89 homolog [Trichonephila inaurata madagascariensis]